MTYSTNTPYKWSRHYRTKRTRRKNKGMPSNEIQKRNIERRELRQLQRLDKISELRKEQTKLKK